MTTALITGANKGLGRETARRLSQIGWTVFLGARDSNRGEAAAKDLSADGADVRFVALDVTSDESVEEAKKVVESNGALDVLVNNAGVFTGRMSPPETGPDDFAECIDVNLLGPVRVTRVFLPLLQMSEHPRIVMVSSNLGSIALCSDPGRRESSFTSLVYPASKAALNMMTIQYAKALPNFRINTVDPGGTATDMNDFRGAKTVEQGASIIVDMAMVSPDGPTGSFFDDQGPLPW